MRKIDFAFFSNQQVVDPIAILQGRIINLGVSCSQPPSGIKEGCLLFKLEGNITCNLAFGRPELQGKTFLTVLDRPCCWVTLHRMSVFITVEVQQMKYFQTNCLEKFCTLLKAFTLVSILPSGLFYPASVHQVLCVNFL